MNYSLRTFLGAMRSRFAVALLGLLSFTPALAFAGSTPSIDIWWPAEGAVVTGTQPFKALVQNTDVSNYSMTWRVDGGTENQMPTDWRDYPHKEASVNLDGWNWRGTGPYTITFTARSANGSVIGTKTVQISTGAQAKPVSIPTVSTAPATQPAAPAVTTQAQTQPIVTKQTTPTPVTKSGPAPTQTVTPVVVTVPTDSSNKLYVDSNAPAARQAASWASSRPADAALMTKLAAQATAVWFGGWNTNVEADTKALVDKAAQSGSTPTLVLYNIPHRDCGSYSAGGTTADKYRDWVRAVARGIGDRSAIVILEPDALAGVDCLSSELKNERLTLLRDAVNILKAKSKVQVYLDAGNAKWIGADEMAKRLNGANISAANGFSLNVSNFMTTSDNTAYGTTLSSKVGGKHFVIDTSRNGNGPTGDHQWCNPSGRAVGTKPTTSTGNPLVDAYLWLKVPGESDGSCNGAPSAGSWMPDYALGLAKSAGW